MFRRQSDGKCVNVWIDLYSASLPRLQLCFSQWTPTVFLYQVTYKPTAPTPWLLLGSSQLNMIHSLQACQYLFKSDAQGHVSYLVIVFSSSSIILEKFGSWWTIIIIITSHAYVWFCSVIRAGKEVFQFFGINKIKCDRICRIKASDGIWHPAGWLPCICHFKNLQY